MANNLKNNEYLLGVNEAELERLRFQHTAWKKVTDNFFDRLQIQQGWSCLEVGAGPGFTSMDLRNRVSSSGEITVLEPSQFYLDWFRGEAIKRGWTNVKYIQDRVEDAQLPQQYFDFIFFRWVISFVTQPEKFIERLIASLRPGGIIALQDYWYEGVSLYPRGTVFERRREIGLAYYRFGGGDPYVTGRVPSIFRRHGLRIIDFSPNQIAGGPESDIWEWEHQFLSMHLPLMVEKGVISRKECDAQLANWNAQRKNPNAIYFSPIVVDVAAKS